MALNNPIVTTHPSIPTATWTKVNAIQGRDRRILILLNEDAVNGFRFETCGDSDATSLGASSGLPLGPASAGVGSGGVYMEDYDNLSNQDVYVYQASGGALTTLAVKEGS